MTTTRRGWAGVVVPAALALAEPRSLMNSTADEAHEDDPTQVADTWTIGPWYRRDL